MERGARPAHECVQLMQPHAHAGMQAVENFYRRLIKGHTSLTEIGLRHAGDYQAAYSVALPIRDEAALQKSVSPEPEHSRREAARPHSPPGGQETAASPGGSAGQPSALETTVAVQEEEREAEAGSSGRGEAGEASPAGRSIMRREKRTRDKRPRITYQVELAYWGPEFCGWAGQPERLGLRTVEAAVEAGIREVVPPAASRSMVSSAGRTDKGVSAAAQVGPLPLPLFSSFFSFSSFPFLLVGAHSSSSLLFLLSSGPPPPFTPPKETCRFSQKPRSLAGGVLLHEGGHPARRPCLGH
jgi:hypothetical protein